MSATMVDIEWRISDAPVPYDEAVAAMEARVAAIRAGTRAGAGLAARASAALHRRHQRQASATWSIPSSSRSIAPAAAGNTPITARASASAMSCSTCSGAAPTCAPMSRDLEEWLIRTLARFNVKGERATGPRRHLGRPRAAARESKIAAIGVRVRHWVTLPRRRAQRRSRPGALPRHRPLRHPRARRHLAGRAGHYRRHAGGRRGDEARVRRGLHPGACDDANQGWLITTTLVAGSCFADVFTARICLASSST